jgi:hypothetical protein
MANMTSTVSTSSWNLPMMRALGERLAKMERDEGPGSVERYLLGRMENTVTGDLEAYGSAALAARVCKEWAEESAFASVICEEKLAASLMASRIPPECMPEIQAPWSTFLLHLPQDTLRAHDLTPANGWTGSRYLKWVFIQNRPAPPGVDTTIEGTHVQWLVWTATSECGPEFPLPCRTLEEMILISESKRAFPTDAMGRPRSWEPEGRDAEANPEAIATTMGMVLRLAMGVILELCSTGASETIRAEATRRASIRRRHGLPQSHVYKLTRAVTVDLRAHVRRASEAGESKTVTVQTLVRGHWKPRLSAKVGRPVHIEPYWRGPSDAPIAVRPHILNSGKQAAE